MDPCAAAFGKETTPTAQACCCETPRRLCVDRFVKPGRSRPTNRRPARRALKSRRAPQRCCAKSACRTVRHCALSCGTNCLCVGNGDRPIHERPALGHGQHNNRCTTAMRGLGGFRADLASSCTHLDDAHVESGQRGPRLNRPGSSASVMFRLATLIVGNPEWASRPAPWWQL